jgi:hypothetical protein
MPLLLAFFLPAVTMRPRAGSAAGTLEMLLTLPIVPLQAVLGKYVAALALAVASWRARCRWWSCWRAGTPTQGSSPGYLGCSCWRDVLAWPLPLQPQPGRRAS